jgi:effector-binding domain-containing protein
MLMPIGRFARASRLSIKSLRNYDESGLLPAVLVDPESGYRYYRLEQLGRAETIRSLRALDVPLAQVAEILAGDRSEETLTLHLAALTDQRDEYDRKLQELQRLIARKDFVMSDTVIVKLIPAQLAATSRTTTTLKTVFADIPAGFGRVLAVLDGAGIDPVGAPFTVFHQAPDADSAGDIALCVPIGVAVRGAADIEVTKFDENVVASVVHHGSYEDMGESYATVSAWIHRHGHRIVGPTREIYLNSPAEVAEDALLTEIQFPIDSDAGQANGS